jgi:putative ATP-dependent endonuclease of the OLD family
MHLVRCEIANYRSIPPRGVVLNPARDGVVLVGKNNAGKSNIIDALGLILGPKNPRFIGIDETDFFDPSLPLKVEIEFAGCDWGTAKQLGLSDAQCHALKHESSGKVRRDPGHITARLTISPEGPVEDENDDDSKTGRDFVLLLGNYHEVKRTEPVRTRLARLVSVPTVRDQAQVLKTTAWTAYGRLLRDLIEGASEAEELRRLIQEASELLQDVLGTEMRQLASAARLTAFVDTLVFRITQQGDPLELLKTIAVGVEYAGRTDDLSDVGTGTQSVVILGVLELCLRRITIPGLLFFVVEEPELYLHPQAQRHVAALLRRVGSEPNVQLIMTTHSAELVSGTEPAGIVRVTRDPGDNGTMCRSGIGLNWPRDDWRRLIHSRNAEAAFADRVVLVEGESEEILLPSIARVVSQADGSTCDPDALNMSYVSMGGKDRLTKFTDLLDRLEIEWRVVADRDVLDGDTLQVFRERAGISNSDPDEKQIREFRKLGIAVLADGEIEDYYPREGLADLSGLSLEEVESEIESRRSVYEDPTVFAILTNLVKLHGAALSEIPHDKAAKKLKPLYDQTLTLMRKEGAVATEDRSMSAILTMWLGTSKPALALRMSDWLVEDVSRIPKRLSALVCWLAA